MRLLEHTGIENVIETARKAGISSPLPPYLPLALGAADLTLIEHTSAFTIFADDGIHIEPHYIRRVTSYDGAVLEEAHPTVTDVLQPDTARTMVAMLEDVVQFGTGVRAKELGRPSGGKTGTTNDFTDAWYIGFTPEITTGVWVGNDDKRILLGARPRNRCTRSAADLAGIHAARAVAGTPAHDFQNVLPLEKIAPTKAVEVDTADSAPPADVTEQGLENANAPPAAAPPTPAPTPGVPTPASTPQPDAKTPQKIAATGAALAAPPGAAH